MRWPLGGRRRGRPVLPSRHPEPPAAPPAATPAAAPQGYPPPARAYRTDPPLPTTQRVDLTPSGPPAGRPAAPAPPPDNDRPGPGPPADGDESPATRGELRSLRRWLAVAGAWAVAATVVAVLAFLTASDDDDQRLAETSAQSRAVQRRVNSQVNELEQRLQAVPKANSVASLQSSITHLQRVVGRLRSSIGTNDRDIGEVAASVRSLENTVSELETQVDEAAQSQSP
jgi:hypothetical protein